MITPDTLESLHWLHPAADYHEDDGAVLWWHVPIDEPPYVGAPEVYHQDRTPTLCSRLIESGYLNYWSRIPQVVQPDGRGNGCSCANPRVDLTTSVCDCISQRWEHCSCHDAKAHQ